MVGRSVTLHSPDSGAQLLASTYGAQGLHMKGALTLRRRASGRLAPMRKAGGSVRGGVGAAAYVDLSKT